MAKRKTGTGVGIGVRIGGVYWATVAGRPGPLRVLVLEEHQWPDGRTGWTGVEPDGGEDLEVERLLGPAQDGRGRPLPCPAAGRRGR